MTPPQPAQRVTPPRLPELGELAHLLFEWPIRESPRLALPFCLFIATIIQAGIIILFSISYSTPEQKLPTSPQIYFLPPDCEAAHQLAPWLAANDPAVFSPQYNTRDVFPPPPPLKYRPSFEEPPPPLRPLPLLADLPVVSSPLPQLRAALREKATHPAAILAPRIPLIPQTVVHWQDDLALRRITSPLTYPQAENAAARPALYEVEVSAEGVPMHCIQLDSSGDPASDEAGSIWIDAQRFEPAAESSWGRVLLLWGQSATNSSPTRP